MSVITETASPNKLHSRHGDEILLQPFNFFASIYPDDNNVLAVFWKSFNYWLQLPDEKLKELMDLLQHAYTVFDTIDDILDGSTQRKGVPTSSLIFGLDRTLTSVNMANIIIFEKIMELRHPQAIDFFIQGGLSLFRGQGMEIYWRENNICPTEEEYNLMIEHKSGGSLSFGVRILQLFSENKADFSKIIKPLGLFAQIFNDYINLRSEKYMKLKGYCEDLNEGKFSHPIIHAIQTHPEDDRIINIIKQKNMDDENKKYCLSLLEKYGSFEYTKQVLKQLRDEIAEEAEHLGGNPGIMQILDYCCMKVDEDNYLL